MSTEEHTQATMDADRDRPITLTFVIPSYNVEEYLGRCVSSLLIGQDTDDLEILIVNDGSKDGTSRLAHTFEAQHPDIIRVIDQPNKGHGGAVNTGIANARGTYLKVVDADDWLDTTALRNVLTELRVQAKADAPVDLVIANYTYDKQGKRLKQTIRYRSVLPKNRIIGWNEVKKFRIDQNLLMHSLLYRTAVLREKANLQLPEHTFYVDNLFAYAPLPKVRTLMYLDEDLYRYFIGREGQSVQKNTMIKRIDQQVRVSRLMVESTPARASVPEGLYRYMIHYLRINFAVTSVFMVLSHNKEHYQEKNELWDYLAQNRPEAFATIHKTLIGKLLTIKGPLGRMLIRFGYSVAHTFFGVN